jgi:hypothetical protein
MCAHRIVLACIALFLPLGSLPATADCVYPQILGDEPILPKSTDARDITANEGLTYIIAMGPKLKQGGWQNIDVNIRAEFKANSHDDGRELCNSAKNYNARREANYTVCAFNVRKEEVAKEFQRQRRVDITITNIQNDRKTYQLVCGGNLHVNINE